MPKLDTGATYRIGGRDVVVCAWGHDADRPYTEGDRQAHDATAPHYRTLAEARKAIKEASVGQS